MSGQYKEINVKCPVCFSEKIIKLPKTLFQQKKFGNIKVQVSKGLVCDKHPFILFIDNNAVVKGYEKIDFQFDIPIEEEEIELTEEIIEKFSLNDILKRWGTYILYNLLHGYIFNYPIYILLRKEIPDLTDSINELIPKFKPTQLNKTGTISSIEFKTYDAIELAEDKSLLIDPSGIVIQSPWSSKLKFEEEIVKKALDIIDVQGQNIIIKKEIEKFLIQADKIVDLLKQVNSIYDVDLIEKLSDELMQPKISNDRLNALREYITRKYNPKIVKKIKNKVREFLRFL